MDILLELSIEPMYFRHINEAVVPRSIIELLSSSDTVSPYVGHGDYSKRVILNWEKQYEKLSNPLEKAAWTLKTQNWISTVKIVSIK